MKTATQTTQEIHFNDPTNNGKVAVRDQPERQPVEVPPTPMPIVQREDVAKLAGAIAKVMAEIGVITKTGEHKHFHFKFTTANDLLTKLTPLMGKNGIAVIQDEVSRTFVEQNYVAAVYEFTIMHESGAVWPHRPRFTGLSLAKSEKGGFDPACLNKCAIAARKYFLLSLFQIPASDIDDADRGDNDVSSQKPGRAPNPSQSVPPAQHRMPHLIPAEGSRATWAKAFDAAIGAAKTIQELSQWKSLNEAALDDIKTNAPKLFSGIDAHYRDIAAKFWTPTKAAETIASFSLEDPSSWPENPDLLLRAVETEMRKFANAHDPGGLGDWFYNEVEANCDGLGLFPPDLEALKRLQDKYMDMAKS